MEEEESHLILTDLVLLLLLCSEPKEIVNLFDEDVVLEEEDFE